MRDRYIVVKKLKSGNKLSESSRFYIQDILFLLFMLLISFMLSGLILEKLFFPFIFFNLFVGLYLVAQSKYNPGKKKYQSIYLWLIAITTTYLPLKNETQRNKTKKMMEKLKNE